jgi:hypothetical protein
MSLETILEEINENKKIAEIDLDTVNPRVRGFKFGQVNSAKNKLEGLYIDYKNELLKRTLFILVTGSDSEIFAEIAERDFKVFSSNAKTLFKEVADQISPQIYLNKTTNASTFDIISNVLDDKLKNLDIIEHQALMFNTKFQKVIKNSNEFVQLISDAVTDIIGSEVVGVDALERTAKKAVNLNYKSKMVPILIHTKDEKLIGDLSKSLRTLSSRVVQVAAGKLTNEDLNVLASLTEVNETNVGDTLKEIAVKA